MSYPQHMYASVPDYTSLIAIDVKNTNDQNGAVGGEPEFLHAICFALDSPSFEKSRLNKQPGRKFSIGTDGIPKKNYGAYKRGISHKARFLKRCSSHLTNSGDASSEEAPRPLPMTSRGDSTTSHPHKFSPLATKAGASMGFLSFLEVASMPIIEVLIISTLGAYMGTGYSNLLPADARKSLNKIVFMVFTPALMFASLVRTVTLEDIISWWFMPVNIGLTFLFGGILGWILVKILKPEPYLEGLIISMSSSGNLGNLLLIIVHAICREKGSPFGDGGVCSTTGLSYASFSMAVGGFYIWTYAYHLIKKSAVEYEIYKESLQKLPSNDFDDNQQAPLLRTEKKDQVAINLSTSRSFKQEQEKLVIRSPRSIPAEQRLKFWEKVKLVLRDIVEEVKAPPTVAAFAGLVFGAIGWLKKLLVGNEAPLRVIQSSIELLGEGTIPCITLILGGNLVQGLRSSKLKVPVIIGVIIIRYVILPVIGIGVVRAANSFGFLPSDPLYQYILLVQFTLPPAMTVGTMTQLVDVGQAECSVLFLWTYVVAAFALTGWSTLYMWLLS